MRRWQVALTFDTEHHDRPAKPGGVERVLAVLAERGVRSTQFLQGRWVQAYPDLARRIAADGHLVGNHSYSHANLTWLSGTGRVDDLGAAERAIRKVTGVDPRPWFRCPYGEGTGDPAVLADVERLGYREVRWHVDSLDWHVHATGPRVARTVVEQVVAHGDGAIVLFHPWTNATHRALPMIVDELRAAGAEFVGVDQVELPGPEVSTDG